MKQQIIFFIGPDRTGKTEISTKLSEELGIPRFKATSEGDNFRGGQNKFLNEILYADPRLIDFLEQTKYSVIFDRGYPCEWVYSKYYGRETDLERLKLTDLKFANMGARIVMCIRSDYNGIYDDDGITSTQLQDIHDEYWNFYLNFESKCDIKILKVDDEDLERQIKEIKDWLWLGD